MTSDETRLATLLEESVPQPPTPFVFQPPAARSRARWLAPLAATVVVAGVAIGVVASRHDDAVPGLGPGIPTSSGSPDAGCPANQPYASGAERIAGSYADVVQLFGRQYSGYAPDGVPATTRDQFGSQVGTVTCNILSLAARRQVTGTLRDGNATGLTVGTPIFAVDGYSPQCRIAAAEGGTVRTFVYPGEGDQTVTPERCEYLVAHDLPFPSSSP